MLEKRSYTFKDLGQPLMACNSLLSALMRFVMKLDLTSEELNAVKDVDLNCSKHISVVNDIYSWEKELKQSRESKEEGSVLCSSIQVISEECKIDIAASKRVLWSMCREWELVHLALTEKKKMYARKEVMTYCKGLEYQMSGNEMWSRATKRYIGIEV